MTASETSHEPEPLFDTEALPGIRPSTARLFGAYLYRQRKSRNLSADVFLQKSGRTPAWLHAIERGEVIPTADTLGVLESRFLEAGVQEVPDSEKVSGLRAAIIELESEPYGRLASDLREGFDLSVEYDELDASNVIGSGPVPIVTSMRQQDRLLILAPVLLSIIAILVGIDIVAWSQADTWGVDLSHRLLLTSALLSFVAFLLTPLDRVLGKAAARVRSDELSTRHDLYHGTRAANGLRLRSDEVPETWFDAGDMPHLVASARDATWRYGLLVDFSERLYTLLLPLPFLAGAATIIVSLLDWLSLRELAVLGYAIGITVMVRVVRSSAHDGSKRLIKALMNGCGLKRVEKEPLQDPDQPPEAPL